MMNQPLENALNFIKNLDKLVPHKLGEDKIMRLTIANSLLAMQMNFLLIVLVHVTKNRSIAIIFAYLNNG